MNKHIAISLEWMHKQVDVLVPGNITPRRLVELLTETFASRGQGLPEKWHFRVKGKPVHLSSGRTLEELQISNGDIFQIIAGENYEMF
ncbi:EsaB/YukD family protein [Lactococcus ileimucosae]|uniref:EsaB/YukD family protein n=1 Tax=Lactococcus ileimucosae TaxID=2941329 RepID=UPI003519D7A3